MSQLCLSPSPDVIYFQQNKAENQASEKTPLTRLKTPSPTNYAAIRCSQENTRNTCEAPQGIAFRNSFAKSPTTVDPLFRPASRISNTQRSDFSHRKSLSFDSVGPLQPLSQNSKLTLQPQQETEFYIPRYSQLRLKILHRKSISDLTNLKYDHQTLPLNIKRSDSQEVILQSKAQPNLSYSSETPKSISNRPTMFRSTSELQNQAAITYYRSNYGKSPTPQDYQLTPVSRQNSSKVYQNKSSTKTMATITFPRSQSVNSNMGNKLTSSAYTLPLNFDNKTFSDKNQLKEKRPNHTRHLSTESQQSVQLRRNSSFATLSDQHSNASGSFYVQEMRRRKASTWCDIPASVWGIPIGIADEYSNRDRLNKSGNDNEIEKEGISRRKSILSRSSSFSQIRRKSLLLTKSLVDGVQRRTMDIRHSHLRPRLLSTEIKDEPFDNDPHQYSSQKMNDDNVPLFEFYDLHQQQIATDKDKELELTMLLNTKDVAHLDCSNASTSYRSFSNSSISSSGSSKFSSYASSPSSPSSSISSTPSALDRKCYTEKIYSRKPSSPSPSARNLSQLSLGTLDEELVSHKVKLFIANPDIPVVEPASG